MAPDPVTLRDVLAKARDAHRRYRDAAGRIDKDGKVSRHPQLMACGDAVREALRLRVEAETLDPSRLDGAWLEDTQAMHVRHDQLMAFYVKYLTPPEAYIQEGAA